ncbi:MAG: hypothetical protein ACE5L7_12195 [Candidatus Aminicenantales bacterium]
MELVIGVPVWFLLGFCIACRGPIPPCPRIWKPLFSAIGGVLGGLAYYFFFPIKGDFTNVDFIASSITAISLACLIYCILCPYFRREAD